MFSDGVIDLVEAGAITNARKVIQTGKIVGGFAFGTKRLYDFLDNNPFVGESSGFKKLSGREESALDCKSYWYFARDQFVAGVPVVYTLYGLSTMSTETGRLDMLLARVPEG